MKKLQIFLIVILALVTLNVAPSRDVNAQMFSSYVSGLTMQNLSGDPASVRIDFYSSDTTGSDTYTDEIIGAYEVVDYASLPSSFKGSVVISSDKPLGAVSTLDGNGKGRGMYTGSSSGSQKMVLPFMMHNWGISSWNTYFSIQNVGDSTATVEIDYASCPALVDNTVTIEPKRMIIVDQADEPCMTGRVITSAELTSNQDIAVVVSQESDIVNSALVSNGYSVGSTNPVIPLVNSNNPDVNGWRTAISLFNLGNVPTNVTLQYVRKDGFECEETRSIAPNSATEFGGNAFILGAPELTCPAGERFIGAAYVTVNTNGVDLVATVNQDRGTLASSYSSFNMDEGSPKIAFPRFVNQFGGNESWDSTFTVMNVGASDIYVECEYTGVDYYTSQLGRIEPYGVKEDLPHYELEANYSGGAVCTAYSDAAYTTVDTSAKIIGIVNTRGFGGPSYNDLMMTYEAVNVPTSD